MWSPNHSGASATSPAGSFANRAFAHVDNAVSHVLAAGLADESSLWLPAIPRPAFADLTVPGDVSSDASSVLSGSFSHTNASVLAAKAELSASVNYSASASGPLPLPQPLLPGAPALPQVISDVHTSFTYCSGRGLASAPAHSAQLTASHPCELTPSPAFLARLLADATDQARLLLGVVVADLPTAPLPAAVTAAVARLAVREYAPAEVTAAAGTRKYIKTYAPMLLPSAFEPDDPADAALEAATAASNEPAAGREPAHVSESRLLALARAAAREAVYTSARFGVDDGGHGSALTGTRWLAYWLDGERLRRESAATVADPVEATEIANPHCATLLAGLSSVASATCTLHGDLHSPAFATHALRTRMPEAHTPALPAPLSSLRDPLLLLLLALAALDTGDRPTARAALTGALTALPLFPDAWAALIEACDSLEQLYSLPLPPHWSLDFLYTLATLHHYRSYEVTCSAGGVLVPAASPPDTVPRILQIPRLLLTPLQRAGQSAARVDAHLTRLESALPGAASVSALASAYLLATGQLAAAEDALRAARAADPLAAGPVCEALAELWLTVGNVGELALLGRAVAATRVYSPSAAYVLAHHDAALDELQDARKEVTRALRLRPRCVRYWLFLAHLYAEEAGRSRSATRAAATRGPRHDAGALAAAALAVAHRLDPNNVGVALSLGALYERWGRAADALSWYDKATAINPDAATAWAQKAQMLSQLGAVTASIAAYRRAVALVDAGDRDSAAIAPLARLLAALGRADEAAEVYRLLFDLPTTPALSPLAVDALAQCIAHLLRFGSPPALTEAAALCRRLLAAVRAAAGDAGPEGLPAAAPASVAVSTGAGGAIESARVAGVRMTLEGIERRLARLTTKQVRAGVAV